ncbi:hypothetical protein VTO42DRAFT_119 [Malbranchea cinnamomea]
MTETVWPCFRPDAAWKLLEQNRLDGLRSKTHEPPLSKTIKTSAHFRAVGGLSMQPTAAAQGERPVPGWLAGGS